MILVSFDAPHFCAGAVFEGKICIHSAPIIKWMKGKTVEEIFDYAKRKKWVIKIV